MRCYTHDTAKKRTIEDMQRIAKEIGGKCLSDNYKNNRVKIMWQCANEQQFLSKSNDVQQGHWCPECAKKLNKTFLRDYPIAHLWVSLRSRAAGFYVAVKSTKCS